jgi:hypothetical protein
MHPISDGIYAFESVRWPGYFVEDLSLPKSLKLKKTNLKTAKDKNYLQFEIVGDLPAIKESPAANNSTVKLLYRDNSAYKAVWVYDDKGSGAK